MLRWSTFNNLCLFQLRLMQSEMNIEEVLRDNSLKVGTKYKGLCT